jgi:hypothetical protein
MNTVTEANLGLKEAIDDFRKEIIGYLEQMLDFKTLDPLEVLILIGGYSARASWMRGRLIRSGSKIADNFRIKELDPFLGEVDRQFKVWSRIVAIREAEYKYSTRSH